MKASYSLAKKVLGRPKRCQLAHAFLWEHCYKRLELAQLLGQLLASISLYFQDQCEICLGCDLDLTDRIALPLNRLYWSAFVWSFAQRSQMFVMRRESRNFQASTDGITWPERKLYRVGPDCGPTLWL